MSDETSEVKDVEVVDIVTGEVRGLVKQDLSGLVKDSDKPILSMVEALDSFDWRSMKPHQMALLLMQKPFQASGSTLYLNFRQALLFATRCYELGLSPFSGEVWYDANRGSVNLSLEGKRQLARNRNIDLGPPQFEELSREWKDVPKITTAGEAAKKAGFTKDMGCRCTIRVGDVKNSEHVSYVAWINDWFVSKSPVWNEKPNHMLNIRANEKAVTLALGTGISAMPSEEEIGG